MDGWVGGWVSLTNPHCLLFLSFPRSPRTHKHAHTHALGLLCDLLWSDPDKDISGWGENDRGVSFTFGGEVVQKFLHKHDMDLICRAHQVRALTLSLSLARGCGCMPASGCVFVRMHLCMRG